MAQRSKHATPEPISRWAIGLALLMAIACGGGASEAPRLPGSEGPGTEEPGEPTAAFTVDPVRLVVGDEIVVDASGSTSPNGAIVSWAWSFGDGARATGERAMHRYESAGSYLVTLTIEDEAGAVASAEATVVVGAEEEEEPTLFVRIEADMTEGIAPLAVAFAATATGTEASGPLRFTWTFGDGAVGEGERVAHVYARGSYLAQVQVEAEGGLQAAAEIGIEVENAAPVVISPVVEVEQGASVPIDVTATDADGDELRYTLLAGPGFGALAGELPEVLYLPTPTWNGTDAFTYRVEDGHGGEGVGEVTIHVQPLPNRAPVFQSEPVTTAILGGAYRYDVVTHDPDGTIPTLAAVEVPASLSFVDHGDGTGTLSGTFVSREPLAVSLSATDGVETVEQSFEVRPTASPEPRITSFTTRSTAGLYTASLHASWSAMSPAGEELTCGIDLGLGDGLQTVECTGEQTVDTTHWNQAPHAVVRFMVHSASGVAERVRPTPLERPSCPPEILICLGGG